ncbi:MAG TPA: hypothetical protein DEP23_10720 [Ruminococcaceae bacterium]|nr:hypothetical protein [Oscillospiraceae bacterium]
MYRLACPKAGTQKVFCIKWKNRDFRIEITKESVSITTSNKNKIDEKFNIKGSIKTSTAGDKIICRY